MKRALSAALVAFLVSAAVPWGLAVGVWTLGRAVGIIRPVGPPGPVDWLPIELRP